MRAIDAVRRSGIGVGPDCTIRDAALLMDEAGVGSLAIIEGDRLVGIVTDRDLVRRGLAHGLTAEARVDGVMSAPVITISADADLHEAFGIFRTHALRRLAVVRGEQFVGTITIDDLLIDLSADLADLARPITAEVLFSHHDSAPLATTWSRRRITDALAPGGWSSVSRSSNSRLEAAKQFGADVVVNNDREDPLEIVRSLTGGLGGDVAIEAVGVPATFELAAALARPGGHVANIGVHGEPATLHLEDLWIRDITITTGLVDTSSTPTLLRLLTSHQLESSQFVTHHFTLDEFMDAYDVFARAADTGALKVVVTRS